MISPRRALLLAIAFAIVGVTGMARAPQARRASMDTAAEVATAGAPASALKRKTRRTLPAPRRDRPIVSTAAPDTLGTRAWPTATDILALKSARLL